MGNKKSQEDVAADVFGSDRTRDDDETIIKKGEGEGNPSADADPQLEADAEIEGDDDERHFVPVKVHTEERKKFQERLDGLAQQNADLAKQVQALSRARQQPPPQRRQPQLPPPNAEDDPAGYTNHVVRTVAEESLNRHLHTSETSANRHYGKENVGKAKAAARQAGILGDFINDADPYEALMEWHREAETVQAISKDGDLSKFEARIRKEERDKVLAERRASGSDQDFPGTLANATPSGKQGQQISQKSVAKEVFGSDRSRRH